MQNSHRCTSYVKSITKILYPGDGFLLQCLDGDLAEASKIEWQVDRKPIEDSPNIQRTVNGGLVLLNVSNAQTGTYQCLSSGVPIIEYFVQIDDSKYCELKTKFVLFFRRLLKT